ncbi:hypothetical protein FB565_003799 [Actinoplanes lutulentus]|nr:hypothetical protein [Actinoplanes lutulentus]
MRASTLSGFTYAFVDATALRPPSRDAPGARVPRTSSPRRGYREGGFPQIGGEFAAKRPRPMRSGGKQSYSLTVRKQVLSVT